MTNWFLCCNSFPSFVIFRSDPFIQIINTVGGDKSIKTLTITHLKTFVNAEWRDFITLSQKESHNHHARSCLINFVNFSMIVVL